MDLDVIYQLNDFIIKKQRGAFITYPELDNVYNLAQIDLLNEYLDEYALNGKIHNALSPFKTNTQFTHSTTPNGIFTLPDDYILPLMSYTQWYDNVRSEIQYGEITFYNEAEWVSAINSQLRPCTSQTPAAKIIAGTMQLHPASANAGIFNYVKRPDAPAYVYTQSGRTITYSPSSSTQLEWNDLYIPKLIMKAMSYQGQFLNEAQITAFAEEKNKQTV